MKTVFSTFNPFPSSPSVATVDRKQFQSCIKIVFNKKTRPFFWSSIDVKTPFSLLKEYLITCHRPFKVERGEGGL